MKQFLFAVALCLIPALAQAQSTYRHDRSGSVYNWNNGNSYSTQRNPHGGATVNGFNSNTGSSWRTQIQPNGSMSGTDSQGNYWTYDRNSGLYMNYGTGRMCTGKGAARFCN